MLSDWTTEARKLLCNSHVALLRFLGAELADNAKAAVQSQLAHCSPSMSHTLFCSHHYHIGTLVTSPVPTRISHTTTNPKSL